MATVTGLTAARMIEIEANSIVSGAVDVNGHLILTTHGGEEIDAGYVEPDRLFSVTDSATIDLTITGNGSLATPWSVTAGVKTIDASKVDAGVLHIDRIPNLTATALLESTYRGGPAKVKIAGVLSTESYRWSTPYVPSASRTVRLLKVGTTWEILGQTNDGELPLALNLANWSTYAELTNTTIFNGYPKSVLLPSGLVVLSGLISAIGTPADGSVIATLPPDRRPDHGMVFSVEVSDTARSIFVKANGDIVVYGGVFPVSNGYISLDGIAFYAAGVPTWTPIGTGGSAWGANFESNSGWEAEYGVPSFWKDPYGFVWFKGLVRIKVATSTDNTSMFTLPTTHRTGVLDLHLRTNIQNGLGIVGARPGDGVNWKVGSSTGVVGSWVSLAGLVVPTTDSLSLNTWKNPRTLSNSWLINNASHAQPAFVLREDGLRMVFGLVKSGSIPGRIFSLTEKEFWPTDGRIIFGTIAAAARARIDLYSAKDTGTGFDSGAFTAVQGTNTWFSMDGKYWIT